MITEQQYSILKRLADGDTDFTKSSEDADLTTTALLLALQIAGLVAPEMKYGVWTKKITEAGRLAAKEFEAQA